MLSSSVDKVTTATYNFVSVILNVAFAGASILSVASTEGSTLELAFLAVYFVISIKTEFSDHAKVRHTSQAINGMSKVLQKLLKCFNGTTISRFFFSLFNHIYHHIFLQMTKDRIV